MSIEAMKRVVEAFDALPPDHPARYANLQINLLRTAIQQAEAKTDEMGPLFVKGALSGIVDAQVRDLWPTKQAQKGD